MRRLFNAFLVAVLLGSVVFVLWKANLLPFLKDGQKGPSEDLPQLRPTARDTLRIAVADRPEKLLVSALQRMLDVKNLKLEVVEYDPDTVWLELSSGELDVAIAPLSEAVKGQARFSAGRFLFVSGLSVGLDQLRAMKEIKPKLIAVGAESGQELLALQNFPEARLVLAEDHQRLESWLRSGSVEAAVFQNAALSDDLLKSTVTLGATSKENPEPTLVVLSKVFAETPSEVDLSTRLEVLKATLESWGGLIRYLDTQPELLRSKLKQEAEQYDLDVDLVLEDYRFLKPPYGRALLERDSELLQETLDLMAFVAVPNLSAPDWSATLELPASLKGEFPPTELRETGSQQPLPEATPTPTVTPDASPTPQSSPTTTATAEARGTHHFDGAAPADNVAGWLSKSLEASVPMAASMPPALSQTQIAVATPEGLSVHNIDSWTEAPKFTAASNPGGPPLSDGESFFCYTSTNLYCLKPNGTVGWTATLEGSPTSASLSGNRLALTLRKASGEGSLTCFSTMDGSKVWEAPLVDAPASPVTLTRGSQSFALLVDAGGTLRCWDARYGSLSWQQSVGTPTNIAPSAFGQTVALAHPEGRVSHYSLANGSVLWQAELGVKLAASPTLLKDQILAPSLDGKLYWLSKSKGDLLRKADLSAPLSTPSVVVGERVIQTSEDGKAHLLDAQSGSLISSGSLGVGWLSAPVFNSRGWCWLDSEGTLTYLER